MSAVPDTDPAPSHDVGAVLRITAFRRLWLALGLSSFGDWLGLLATTAMAASLSHGSYAQANLAVSAVFIARLAPAVVLGPIAGAMADRMSRKVTMVAGDLLRFALFVSIAFVGTLEWLYIATVLIECVAVFWMPAKEATVPNLVPPHRLEAANQISLATTYGSAPLAALVYSGISLLNGILDNFLSLLRTNPVGLALYLNALTFLVSALTVSTLTIPQGTTAEGAPRVGLMRSIVDGWVFVGTTPLVRGLVLGMLGAFAAAGLVVGLAHTYVLDLGAGNPGYGALFAGVFTGLAAGMWLGPRLLDGFSRRRLFGISLITAGVFLTGMAIFPDVVVAVILSVGLGACGGVAWVTGYTLLGVEVDDAVRGRTFGFLTSAARVVLTLVLVLGPALAGLVGRRTIHFSEGMAPTYSGAALVFLLAAMTAVLMGLMAYRQMDDRPGTSLWHDLAQSWRARREVPQVAAHARHAGLFIVFEGGDGSGKSTQARLLADWLREDQGHDVVLTREPGATKMGLELRELLLTTGSAVNPRAEALLFAADRAQHVDEVVVPALKRGAVVVSDRYIDSSVAYQGSGRALDADDIGRLSRWATNGLVPDLTILLDVDPEVSAARRAADDTRAGDDRMESLPDDFHARVRSRFLARARSEPHRYLVLDAERSKTDLHEVIRTRVRDVLGLSPARRAALGEQLSEESRVWKVRAAAASQVHRLDATLSSRKRSAEPTEASQPEAASAPAAPAAAPAPASAPVTQDEAEQA